LPSAHLRINSSSLERGCSLYKESVMKPFVQFRTVLQGDRLRADGYSIYIGNPEAGHHDEAELVKQSAEIDYAMMVDHVSSQLNELVEYVQGLEHAAGAKDMTHNLYRFKENCETLGAYWQRNGRVIRPDLTHN